MDPVGRVAANGDRPGGRVSDELQLFDPRTVAPVMCPFCAATTPEDCAWERRLDRGGLDNVSRPLDCLASWDPASAEIPF